MAFTKNTDSTLPFMMVNAATGAVLTGATPTARRVLDGGVQVAATGSVSELGNGQYVLAGQADDFNADNSVGFLFTAAGAVPTHLLVQIGRFHKGTAYNIPFKMIKVADGSALTGASPTGRMTIDGAAQVNVGGAFVERGNGQYVYQGVAGDFNGDDTVGFIFTAATGAPVHLAIDIEPALVTADGTLKGQLYSILTTDAIVNDPSYLGGMLGKTTTIPYGVYYRNPPEKPDAPVLTYSVGSQVRGGGSTELAPRDLFFTFTAWGDNFDEILNRVFALLQKKKEITATDYTTQAIMFENTGPELFDDNLKIYYRADTFRVIAVKT